MPTFCVASVQKCLNRKHNCLLFKAQAETQLLVKFRNSHKTTQEWSDMIRKKYVKIPQEISNDITIGNKELSDIDFMQNKPFENNSGQF